MIQEELQGKNVSELKQLARDMELAGYSHLRKDELIELILAEQTPSLEEADEAAEASAKLTPEPAASAPVAPVAFKEDKPFAAAVLAHVSLVRDAKRSGYRVIHVPYINADVEAKVRAQLTKAEEGIAVFGGEPRGAVG